MVRSACTSPAQDAAECAALGIESRRLAVATDRHRFVEFADLQRHAAARVAAADANVLDDGGVEPGEVYSQRVASVGQTLDHRHAFVAGRGRRGDRLAGRAILARDRDPCLLDHGVRLVRDGHEQPAAACLLLSRRGRSQRGDERAHQSE
jgi:hypothetical protein